MSPPLKRVISCAVALVATTFVALGLYGSNSPHFEHGAERVLQALSSSSSSTGLKMTLHLKNGFDENNQLYQNIEGFVFPRTTTSSNEKLEIDARISYVFMNKLYNFTLVENKGFMTIQDMQTRKIEQSACLKRQNIPPVHTLMDALRNARVIDHVNSLDVPCPEGKLVEFKFANEPYVFCNSENLLTNPEKMFREPEKNAKPGKQEYVIYGHDLDTKLQLFSPEEAHQPTRDMLAPPSNLNMEKCEPLQVEPANTQAVSASEQLELFKQKAKDVFHVATGQRRLAEADDEDQQKCTECKDGKKACLFVHGLGTDEDKGVLDEYKGYWGEIKRRATCCSSIKFLHMNTMDNNWYDGKLAKEMCDAAMEMTNSKNPMELENIALVGHSMGNLVISAAVMNKQCKIGSTSKWIALQGPFMGSMSASFSLDVCKMQGTDTEDSQQQSLLRQLKLCPARGAVKSLVFMTSKYATAETKGNFEKAQEVFRQLVSSGLCGVSPTGLQSPSSSIFALANAFSGHLTAINDGVVEFSSCRGGLDEARFQPTWKSNKWYKADINHADGRFTNGDGWWGDSRKPIKWFQCQF